MRRLSVFNNISLDGYFTDTRGDMSWAHRNDPEWVDFTKSNAQGDGMMLFGSSEIISQLTAAKLIDQYQFVTVPVVIGSGRTMFEGVPEKLELERVDSRSFSNGNIVNTYRLKQ